MTQPNPDLARPMLRRLAPLASTDLWMAFFRDCEGNLLALQTEVARAS